MRTSDSARVERNRAQVREQAEALLGREPDVVALQEVTPSSAALFREHLGRAGLPHIAYSNAPASPKSRSLGVLVASRHRLEPIPPLHVPWPEKALSVLVRADDVELDLHAVHVPPGTSNAWIKIETLEGIHRGLAHASARSRLLCGDFNAPQRELPSGRVVTWAEAVSGADFRLASRIAGGPGERWDAAERAVLTGLAAYDLPDIFRLLHGYGVEGFSWALTHKGREIRRRIDHVFASRSLGPQECTYLHAWREGKLSDHAAIEAVFRRAAVGAAADEPGRRRG